MTLGEPKRAEPRFDWQAAAAKMNNENAELRRVAKERDALLREVGREQHRINGHAAFPFEECFGFPCSRIRAALQPEAVEHRHVCGCCKTGSLHSPACLLIRGEHNRAVTAAECGDCGGGK